MKSKRDKCVERVSQASSSLLMAAYYYSQYMNVTLEQAIKYLHTAMLETILEELPLTAPALSLLDS